jgi:hypothetical protein
MTNRAVELSKQLAETNIDHLVVDTSNRTVGEVARQIRANAGNWPGPRSRSWNPGVGIQSAL